MKIGPRYKIGKRLGASVFEKCQTQKFMLSEARSKKRRSSRRPRQLSDFGKQLLEKQKVRYTYGITEKQLSKYVKEATQSPSESKNRVYQGLESRLDNIVYRFGIVHTRRFARQVVSHGHIMVNGRRVTIPSYKIGIKDVISVRENSKDKGLFIDLEERLKNNTVPKWLIFDSKKLEGKMSSLPDFGVADISLDFDLVLESYSR
ncbi:MAG TPA: 30S ribosomal protein S4 [Candidatus Kaiserbacteria bacterium]|nr:30S ribosomal protein S4 [Candidatus Kaiserbacteria bacterium]